MTNLNTENLRICIKKEAVFQLINCLIETDEKEITNVKDFVSSQITENNWEVLNKCQTCEKGFDELADWALEDDNIVSIELIEPIHDEYYIAVCFPKENFVRTVL